MFKASKAVKHQTRLFRDVVGSPSSREAQNWTGQKGPEQPELILLCSASA